MNWSGRENATVAALTPSRSALWLNWRIARYGVNERVREHGKAMLVWILTYHPELVVRETAQGMLKALEKNP